MEEQIDSISLTEFRCNERINNFFKWEILIMKIFLTLKIINLERENISIIIINFAKS